jgi:hypothetical protein
MKKPFRFFVFLTLFALTLSGCASLVYNRLDTIVGHYLERFVSLDDMQRTKLDAWLEEVLTWHKTSELRRYATFLRELSIQTARQGTHASYGAAERQLEGFWQDLLARTAPDAAHLLMSLTPGQVQELSKNLAERGQQRYDKERAAIASGKWQAERAKEIQQQMRRLTGAVTDEQRRVIDAAAQKFQPTNDEWNASLTRWRNELGALLLNRDQPGTEAQLSRLLANADREWTAQYTAKRDYNRDQSLALIATLDATLTREQRARLQRELAKLAAKIESLTES